MNRNLVGSIYGRPSIKIAHFVPIHHQTWLPQAILVSDCYTKKISQISMYYVETRADNSGYANHRVTCLVVMGSMFVNGSELNEQSKLNTLVESVDPNLLTS
jgi:hypothetical protein